MSTMGRAGRCRGRVFGSGSFVTALSAIFEGFVRSGRGGYWGVSGFAIGVASPVGQSGSPHPPKVVSASAWESSGSFRMARSWTDMGARVECKIGGPRVAGAMGVGLASCVWMTAG